MSTTPDPAAISRPTFVRVFYADHHEEDAAFAREIVSRVSSFAKAEAMELSRFTIAAKSSPWKLAFALGCPVFIVRPQVIAAVTENPLLGHPQFRSYYICRDFVPAELGDAIESLLDEVMLVPDSDEGVNEVVEDLREYAAYWRSQRLSWKPLLAFLGGASLLVTDWIVRAVEFVLRIVQLLSGVSAVLLLISLWVSRLVPYRWFMAVACGYMWGRRLTWIAPLDLWPWLGRALRSNIGEYILRRFRGMRAGGLLVQFGVAIVYAIPSALARSMKWLWLGVVGGVLMDLLMQWSGARVVRLFAEESGLTSTAIAEDQTSTAAAPAVPLTAAQDGLTEDERALFTNTDLATVRRWISLQIGGVRVMARPFFRQPDYVFISYPWADAGAAATARALAETLLQSEIPFFLDRRSVANGFVGWRANVARELQRATHVVVIASPLFARARIVRREIQMALHRQHDELLPSLLCVADHDTAELLLRDSGTPLELRFILLRCARLTPADVADEQVVRHAIVSRRRQGRVRDWLTMLRPTASEAAMRRQLSI